MSKDETKSSARRRLLKNTLLGGATVTSGIAGAKWVKPSVQSVLLPAHANTTDSGGDPGSGTEDLLGPYFGAVPQFAVSTDQQQEGMLASLADSLVRPAQAQQVFLAPQICITMTSATTVNIKYAEWLPFPGSRKGGADQADDDAPVMEINGGYVLFEGNGSLDSTISVLDTACNFFIGYKMEVSMPTPSNIQVTLFGKINASVPAATCALPLTICPKIPECEIDSDDVCDVF